MSKVIPSDHHVAITPSDVTEYKTLRALYVLTDGNLNLEDKLGTQLVYPVTAGQVLPLSVVKVLATSTTATCIGWY